MRVIDVRSDTVTKPTEAMRKAMYECPVGDDVARDDPTVNELEREAARILGKEAALFCTSGTQSNQIGIMTWATRGEEVITGENAHVYNNEVGAISVLAGANVRPLHFEKDIPDCETIENAIQDEDIHHPVTTLICLENALANGRVVPVETMKEIHEMAKRHGIPVHLDGARCFNAAVALGVDIKELVSHVDSVSCCLSKGLCAPVGSVLAGSREFIEKARKHRKMLGGGMRQAGVIAAPALIAIRDMPKRLYIDHENAKYLAEGLARIPGIFCDTEAVQVDIVFFTVEGGDEKCEGLKNALELAGVKVNPARKGKFRMVTNAEVTRKDMDVILDTIAAYMKG